jgi:CRISPR/Cas system-associated endonuclease/helicase Cas3
VEHLSTALTPIDREITLGRVKKRLNVSGDTDWVLVATSCIEADVELSFRTGFRELSSLVSLLQTSTCVNRNGELPHAEIWTFRLAPGQLLIENPGMKDSSKILRGYIEQNREISSTLSTESIADEIRLNGVTGKYKKLLEQERVLSFKTVEKDFRVIESDMRIAVIEEAVISRLKRNTMNWQKLQRNSVRIAYYKLKELDAEEILPEIYKWELAYDDFLGYMAGIIELKKFDDWAMIVWNLKQNLVC